MFRSPRFGQGASFRARRSPNFQVRRARSDAPYLEQVKAVIFDMDGVIVDSEPRHERAFLQVLEEIGYGNTHEINFADYIGRSDRVIWEDFLKCHKAVQTIDELLAMKRERMVKIIK